MLEAIAELGALRIRQQEADDPIEIMMETPKATHVLALTFGLDPVTYRDIQVSEYDPARARDYFLTTGPSMGSLGTPTAMVTEPDRTFNMRLVGWCNKVRGSQGKLNHCLPQAQAAWLDNFLGEFERKKDELQADFARAVGPVAGARNRIMVTVRFQAEERALWPGNPGLPFRQIYRFLFAQDIFARSSAEGVCSVCEERTLVSGRVGSEVFPFATFDKPGFIAGGLDQRYTWRNLPLCMDCYIKLKAGRDYVDGQMTFRFSGLQYWLIPKFMVDLRRSAEALDVLGFWERRQSLRETVARRITGDEDEILEILAAQKDFLTLSFVFVERTQAMERILMCADDVLPSRLRRIFEAKQCVDRAPFLQERGLTYDFSRLRPFFVKQKGRGRDEVIWKPFLTVVAHVLRGQRLDRDHFLATLTERIRQDAANIRAIRSAHLGGLVTWTEADRGQQLWLIPVEAWMNLVFLERLGILINKEGGERPMDRGALGQNDFTRAMDDLFAEYPGTFYDDATKAAFTLGSLTQMLLDVQYSDRKATPFLKHLKGLRLTPLDLRELLPKVQNKLQEYDQFTLSRRKLASATSEYLVRADRRFPAMSSDEASFYFVLGMNLVGIVWDRLRPQSDEVEQVGEVAANGDDRQDVGAFAV
ncbi:MAG: TIGR02556 family CRISPR-associated protein [Chloroflexi bacterium]|nr:TIGR02556 family CRISPR-associated protein [Chloroflexota bacterium]